MTRMPEIDPVGAIGFNRFEHCLEQIPIRLVGFGIEHLCGSVRKPAKALIPFPQTDVESALAIEFA